jgi:TIR domain
VLSPAAYVTWITAPARWPLRYRARPVTSFLLNCGGGGNQFTMSSLADLPELVGFFSYSRDDDEDFKGSLSALRDGIQRELRAQLGRNRTNFRLFQDQEAIVPGKQWEMELKNAIGQSIFFIPLITPRSVGSKYCQFEFESFLAREQAIGRADLIFPILYIPVPALQNDAKWRGDPVLSIVGQRQYVDWRSVRHLEVNTPVVREKIADFCRTIAEALNETWTSPEERQRLEEAKARQLAEEQRMKAEAQQRAEEEQRQRLEEAKARQLAEEQRMKAKAQQRAEEEQRQRQTEAKTQQRAKRERDNAIEEAAARKTMVEESRRNTDKNDKTVRENEPEVTDARSGLLTKAAQVFLDEFLNQVRYALLGYFIAGVSATVTVTSLTTNATSGVAVGLVALIASIGARVFYSQRKFFDIAAEGAVVCALEFILMILMVANYTPPQWVSAKDFLLPFFFGGTVVAILICIGLSFLKARKYAGQVTNNGDR